MEMNVKVFQQITDSLLRKHYGIEINDTVISDDRVAEQAIEKKICPHQAVSELADEGGFNRIDIQWGFGIPARAALTEKDEIAAYKDIWPLFGGGEEIVHCPQCGARTDFVELLGDLQLHSCLDTSCEKKFLIEFNDEEEADQCLQDFIIDNAPQGVWSW